MTRVPRSGVLGGIATRPLRGLLAMLVVFGHASMAFLAPEGTPAPSHWQAGLDAIGEVLNTVRMPAFFVLSGAVAAHTLAAGEDAAFLRDRFVRLALPMCTVLVFVNPIEVALRIAHGGLLGRWQQHPMTEPPIPVPAPGTAVQHLWYVSVLLVLTLLAPWLVAAIRRAVAGSDRRRGGVVTLLVMAAPLAALVLVRVGWRIAPHLGPVTRWQLVDPGAIAHGLGFYVAGIALAIDDAPLHRLLARRRLVLGAVAAGAVAVRVLDPSGDAAERLPREAIAVMIAVPAFALLLDAAARARRVSALLDRYAAASYTTYLLHHVVVVATAIATIALLGVTPLAFVLVLLAGLTVPLLIHERFVAGSHVLRLALNGEMPRSIPGAGARVGG